ncbi:MAG: hypothetical protein IT210_09745 [Armatimonadetes bacterium]|nr:hypothetical protein [Armatimonadota bacterium]
MPSPETVEQQIQLLKDILIRVRTESAEKDYTLEKPIADMEEAEQTFWQECARALYARTPLQSEGRVAIPVIQSEFPALEKLHSCLDTIKLIARAALDQGPEKTEESLETIHSIAEHAQIALVKLLVSRIKPVE